MLKIRVVITKITEGNEKYPVVMLYSYHNGFYITTFIGEEAIPINTLYNENFEEHINEIQDYLATLGIPSDYTIIENEMLENPINRLRND
jgi:hypothetical protein